jgi:formylmethanofuran dehydrogenase subunit E
MGLHGGGLLNVEVPRHDKRMLVLVETEGCFADGIAVATGCWVGRRTLRVVDHGKTAAVFVDTRNGRAIRVAPHRDARGRAVAAVPGVTSRWHAYLSAYQTLPADHLFTAEPVSLTVAVEDLLGQSEVRVECSRCQEEILNGREVVIAGNVVCRTCAGEAYFIRLADSAVSTR